MLDYIIISLSLFIFFAIYDNICYKIKFKMKNSFSLRNVLANIITTSNMIKPYKSPAHKSCIVML